MTKFKRLISFALSVAIGISCFAIGIPMTTVAADPTNSSDAVITKNGDSFTLENAAIKAELSFESGRIGFESLFNKAAEKEYLTGADADNYLFAYTYGEYKSEDFFPVASNDGKWILGETKISEIDMIEEKGAEPTPLGEKVEIVINHTEQPLQVTVILEIYDGVSGIRYYSLVKNTSDKEMTIKEADIVSFNFPNDAHMLHYSGIETMAWSSTSGALAKNNGRNALSVYDEGHGWWIMPETNWKTQVGPKLPDDPKKNDPSNLGKEPEFASISAWSGDNKVKISTNTQSVQLTLFPDEEFEYIGYNINLFKGDVVDGKMAAEEHFRKRFKFHDTTTILNTNDWDYINKRSFEYFEQVIIPKAKRAKVDMIMLDDYWNTTRDSIEPISSIGDLKAFSDMVYDNGFFLGLWYNLAGHDHMQGRDLADPVSLAEKKGHIETLIKEYGMVHQMIDLTEFWQNVNDTDYSHGADNVFRKNVMVRQSLNDLVREYPQYLAKYTNEVDIFPTQGNRNNGLLHMIDNGWLVVNGGFGGGLPAVATSFGYLPLNAQYYGGGGGVVGQMNTYYSYMAARNIKLNTDPGTEWTERGIEIMAIFNDWRKGDRVRELTDGIVRPTYMGPNWDSNNASNWDVYGPYAWMFTSENKDRALMVATTTAAEKKAVINTDVRWLDPAKKYVVSDVTLDNTGLFSLAYLGTFNGADLVKDGFDADLTSSISGGKAYWFEAVEEDTMLVAYADESVKSYTTSQDGTNLTVTVNGTAGDTAAIIVADSANNKGRVVRMTIGEDGSRTVVIPANKLKEPGQVSSGNPNPPTRLEFETLLADGAVDLNPDNNTGNTQNSSPATDANPSGGKYHVVNFRAEGNYINAKIDVPKAGSYIVSFAAKTNENSGIAAIGQNGEPMSAYFNYSQNPLNVFKTISARMDLVEGENIVQIFAMKGATGGMSLRGDYIEFVPVVAADAVITEAEDLMDSITFSHDDFAAVKDDEAASGGKYIDYNSTAAAEWVTIPVTSDIAGSFKASVTFKKGPQYGQIQLFVGGEKQGSAFDQFSTAVGFGEADLGTITFERAGTKELKFLIVGRNKDNETGFAANFDSIKLTSDPSVAASESGAVAVVGDTIDMKEIVSVENMQPAYCKPSSASFEVYTETNFDVAEVDEDGIVKINNLGTAVIRAINKYNPTSFVDYTVTVIPEGTTQNVIDTIKTINTIGVVNSTKESEDLIIAAEQKYNALSANDKAKVTNYAQLRSARLAYDAIKDDEAASSRAEAVVYVENTNYISDLGSTIKKNTCPSGSHLIKFTSDQTPFEHGFGFEPAWKAGSVVGTMLVPIPKGVDKFSAYVGVDYGQSDPGSGYDQQNVVTFKINGEQIFKTERILKNIVDGVETDNSQFVEFAIPEGAEWLLIENDAGRDNFWDHIIFADAKFLNEVVVNVIELISVITPEGVNVSSYSKEIADKLVAAEQAYYALDNDERAMVNNLNKMTSSRNMLANFGMNGTGENDPGLITSDPASAAKVTAAIEKIQAIPQVDEVTETDRDAVVAALAAYDALSDFEKTIIPNIHNMLLAAEKLDEGTNPEPQFAVGDVNKDKMLTVTDIVSLRAVIMDNVKLSDDDFRICDVNEDGKITVTDIVSLRALIMGN